MAFAANEHYPLVFTLVPARCKPSVRRRRPSYGFCCFKSTRKRKENMTVQVRQPQPTELVERTGPEIFRFECSGDCLRGQLLNIETADIGGKPTLKYIIRD